MTAFWVGDIPAEDLVIEPARAGVAVDLTPFDSVSVVFRDPLGEVVESSGFLAEIVDDTVVVEWPTESLLDSAGVYELGLALESSGGFRETVAPVRIIVQDNDGWHNLDSARDGWADAPDNDDILWELLEVARNDVEEYAPILEEGARPPSHYRKGQLGHARNTWNASEVSSSGTIGMDGYAIQPKPLDWAIKQMLRPKNVRPGVEGAT
ncbi:MAG: hypothetical protein JWP85_989 [Rhodoglobus sp.]|nr:hypothetical protein [Rhodoglobus sp.]